MSGVMKTRLERKQEVTWCRRYSTLCAEMHTEARASPRDDDLSAVSGAAISS